MIFVPFTKEPSAKTDLDNKINFSIIIKWLITSLVVKTIMDAASVGYVVAKKVVKGNFTSDPSSNVMNYAKFTAVMAGSKVKSAYEPSGSSGRSLSRFQ